MIPRGGRNTPGDSHVRPRVLLADDHPAVLESLLGLLAADFDLVGTATDGQEAIDAAGRLDPDLIILDITMPTLDGFQACRALRQANSRARVVFLSMHDSDALVGEAFACGGRGYVVKSRACSDLLSAVENVLAGRMFVPSLSALFQLAERGGHVTQLHQDEDAFIEGAVAFFDEALQRGDATCLIASQTVRERLGALLRKRGWKIGGVNGHPRCLVIDTATAVNRIKRNGLPDADRIAEISTELEEYRISASESPTRRLTIFGDMAGTFALEGNGAAVRAMEHLWNKFTHHLPFLTVCNYSTKCFAHETSPSLLSDVSAEHWAVSHARGL